MRKIDFEVLTVIFHKLLFVGRTNKMAEQFENTPFVKHHYCAKLLSAWLEIVESYNSFIDAFKELAEKQEKNPKVINLLLKVALDDVKKVGPALKDMGLIVGLLNKFASPASIEENGGKVPDQLETLLQMISFQKTFGDKMNIMNMNEFIGEHPPDCACHQKDQPEAIEEREGEKDEELSQLEKDESLSDKE